MSKQKPIQVLLAEDSRVRRVLAQRAFEGLAEFQLVKITEDGEQTLRYLRQTGEFADAVLPDLLLLDLEMPKLDGFGVLHEMKRDARLAAIPVVVFSDNEDDEQIAKSYQFGASTFISKPTQFKDLQQCWRNLAQYWNSAQFVSGHRQAA